jgi:WD40 repeat protein
MIYKVIFSPDGQIIASLGASELKLWSRDGTLLKTVNHSAGDVDDMSFTPDGQMIAWQIAES